MDKFKASNGWLESFRKRHNILFRTLSGESAQLDKDIVDNWMRFLPVVTEQYEPHTIRNIYETGLFWRWLPNKSLIMQGEKANGWKLAKERITVCYFVQPTERNLTP